MLRSRLSLLLRHPTRRLYSTPPTPPSSRIARLESRLPSFLRRFTVPLRSAPVSHITAFLILHELTAIVPLFGLAALFHYTNWLPPVVSEGKWVSEGVERFGRYARRKGWIKDDAVWMGRGEGATRVVVEFATAYAVTKLLLPVRLVGSVWATPWFARWTVLPVGRIVARMFGRKTVGTVGAASPAAGTGAVGGGVLPTDVANVARNVKRKGD